MGYCLAPVDIKGKKWWDLVKSESEVKDQFFASEISDASYRILDHDVAHLLSPDKLKCDEITGYSKVINNEEKFEIRLTHTEFTTESSSVSTTSVGDDNMIVIRCGHSSRKDGNGKVSRKLKRSYILPKDCDVSKVEAKITKTMVLVTCAKTEQPLEPRKQSPSPTDLKIDDLTMVTP